MAHLERPFRASYLLSGYPPEEIFAALLDVRRFSEWAVGLHRVRALDATSRAEVFDVRPGTLLEFTLSAAGLTHRVVSTVTAVDFPLRLEWRYTEGAVGSGGLAVLPPGHRRPAPSLHAPLRRVSRIGARGPARPRLRRYSRLPRTPSRLPRTLRLLRSRARPWAPRRPGLRSGR